MIIFFDYITNIGPFRIRGNLFMQNVQLKIWGIPNIIWYKKSPNEGAFEERIKLFNNHSN